MINIMKEAHNLTKKIIKKGDSYKATFRICLSFVHSQVKKGLIKMVELKGTEKQIKWANDIREKFISICEEYKLTKAIEYAERDKAEYWICNHKGLTYNNKKAIINVIKIEIRKIKEECGAYEKDKNGKLIFPKWFLTHKKEFDKVEELENIIREL